MDIFVSVSTYLRRCIMYDSGFDDWEVTSFLMNMQDSYGYGEELISEPTLDNYGKYQDERARQGIELQRFKDRHAADLLSL